MATLQPKTPFARYTPHNYQPANVPPTRSKAFSQLDNLTHHHSKGMHNDSVSPHQNTDKITQIKKKYQKLLNNGMSKPNDTTQNLSTECQRTSYKATEHKWNQQNKIFSETQQVEKIYSGIGENVHTSIKKGSFIEERSGGKSAQLKSSLQCNRNALSAMKSQLQAKLNDLSAKTIMHSALRKNNQEPYPHFSQTTPQPIKEDIHSYSKAISANTKLSYEESKSYEEISSKYAKLTAKYYPQVRPSKGKEKKEDKAKLQQKGATDPSFQDYMTKYANKIIHSSMQKEKHSKQHLSIISEKSNSNNSDSIKQSYKELDDKYLKKGSHVDTSHVRQIIDPRLDDLFRKTTEDGFKPRHKQSQYQHNRWLKNGHSYLQEKSAQPAYDINQKSPKFLSIQKQTAKLQKDNLLSKLQSNIGAIKRATTEETFMINKAALTHPLASQKKEILGNNYIKIKETISKELVKNQPSKYTDIHLDNEVKEATFGKKHQKEPFKIYEATPPKSTYKNIASTTNEIEKFKEKYGRPSHTEASSTKQDLFSQPQKKPSWKNCQFKNNQDLSNQIDKIDQKIKQIQNNKITLNIHFQPYQAKSTPKHTNKTFHQYRKDQQKQGTNDRSLRSYHESKSIYGHREEPSKYSRPRVSSYMDRVQPMFSDIMTPNKTHSNVFSIKLIPVEMSNEEDIWPNDKSLTDINTKIQKKQEFINKIEFQLRTDTGIEQRKRKLQEKVEINNNIKSLVKVFGQQAVIDEVFRNNKIWFASDNKNNKWQSLRKELKENAITMTDSEIKEEFELIQGENNPFFSVSDIKCNIKTLVKSYVQAKKHWEEKLVKKFNKSVLEKQGFNSNKMDLDKKGYILVEDFVRFLNLQSGTFLRNRDVSVIFKRFNKKNAKIKFEELISAVCE